MIAKSLLLEYLKVEKYNISLLLGECSLNEIPLAEDDTSLMFKANLDGVDVVLKFFSPADDSCGKIGWLLEEAQGSVMQFIDYDLLHVQGITIPVLVMKQCASADIAVEYEPRELLQEFCLICRKNFPKELPEFVHCSDQKKIHKLISDFAARKDLFDGKLAYFTDEDKRIFSPTVGKDGFFKFDNTSQFKVLDIWVHSDNDMVNDYILVHHANTFPERVNGKNVYRWAVYEEHTPITWEEAMNGFAENEGEIISLDRAKIEFFNRVPSEGYFFIALNQVHNINNPQHKSILRDYFFRFSFNYVNRYILEDMNSLIRRRSFPKKK